jgi:hypothetical protein
MLMGHLPQIIARGRENVPQGCFEGLIPVQVHMVVQELVAYNSQVKKALADTLEVVQEIAHSTELRGRAPTPFVIPLQLGSLTPILGHHRQRPSGQRVTVI